MWVCVDYWAVFHFFGSEILLLEGQRKISKSWSRVEMKSECYTCRISGHVEPFLTSLIHFH